MSDFLLPESRVDFKDEGKVSLKICGEEERVFSSRGEALAYLNGRQDQADLNRGRYDETAKRLGIEKLNE